MINFREHFELQDRLNRVINPDWLTAGYRWSDAAMVEAVEAFDHLAWKWWKAGTDNMPQFRLELVDIWHFALSDVMACDAKDKNLCGADFAYCTELLNNEYRTHKRHATSGDLKQTLRLFIGVTSCEGYVPFGALFRLCELADLSLPELDRMYRAKGVLNLFRQANGYKEGVYIKEWAGREDNVWLDAIMATTPDANADQLMDQLSRIYHDVLSGATFYQAASGIGETGYQSLISNGIGNAGFPPIDTAALDAAAATRDPEIGFVALGRTVPQCSNAEICYPVTGDPSGDYCDKCGRSA